MEAKSQRIGIISASILISLLPLLRMAWILSRNGEGNPSNDEWGIIVDVVDPVLGGTYPWKNFFENAFYNGHLLLFPLLAQIFFAWTAHFDYQLILHFGLLLSAIQTVLLFDAFTFRAKTPWKWLLLPLLSAAVFSVTQMSVYEFAFNSLQHGLCRTGLIVGAWGLARFAGRWRGIGMAAVGAFLAAWSSASGILAWPVFLLGMVWSGYKRLVQYFAFALAGAICGLPYLYFFLKKSTAFHASGPGLPTWSFILQSIGTPLAVEFSSPETLIRGAIGLLLGAFGVGLLLWAGNRHRLREASPALMLMAFGLLSILQIGAFRVLVASWYGYSFMAYWLGLLGLSLNAAAAFTSKFTENRWLRHSCAIWAAGTLMFVCYALTTSNQSHENKSFYLASRSPVAASCLRNYALAPTYCEPTIFLWGAGNFHLLELLGRSLDRHRLAVFGPRQKWTLQGDVMLGRVLGQSSQGSSKVTWTLNSETTQLRATDYRRLDLLMQGFEQVEWVLDLPLDFKEAEFITAVALRAPPPSYSSQDAMAFRISVETEDGEERKIFSRTIPVSRESQWYPVNIPLDVFRGKRLVIKFASESRGTAKLEGLFRHPYIDMQFSSSGKGIGDTGIDQAARPLNTELGTGLPSPGANDLVFRIEGGGAAKQKFGLDVCASDFSHLYFQAKVSSGHYPRSVRAWIQTIKLPQGREIWIPLLPGEEGHAYGFDLRLLDLEEEDRVTQLEVEPGTASSLIKMADLRLLRKAGKAMLCK